MSRDTDRPAAPAPPADPAPSPAPAATAAAPDVETPVADAPGTGRPVPPAPVGGAPATDAPSPSGDSAANGDPDSEALRVRLEHFEGPLDLLLHLIRRDQVDIYDIPIAHITRQYLDMIETMQLLNLEVAGEFMVMAATLMRIKSRLLLPPSPVDDEEELGDPREELIRRLLEYRKYKEVAGHLRRHEEAHRLRHKKGYTPRVDSDEPVPLKPISLFHLMDVLRALMAREDARETVHEVELPPVTVEERMEHIREMLAGAWGQVRFEEVLADCRARLEIITTFMALLELIRLGEVVARQYEEFGDIWLFDPEALGIARDPVGRRAAPEADGAGGPDHPDHPDHEEESAGEKDPPRAAGGFPTVLLLLVCMASSIQRPLLAGPRTDGSSSTATRLEVELNQVDRFIQSSESGGVALDPRPLEPYSQKIRLSVVPQLLAYYEWYRADGDRRHYQDVVDRANLLVEIFDEIRTADAFDGILAYALLAAHEMTGGSEYLSRAEIIVGECLSRPQGWSMSFNWGLMCAMALAKHYEITRSSESMDRAKRIIDSLRTYGGNGLLNADGSFPHHCPQTKDIHYTSWMAVELIKTGEALAYGEIDSILSETHAFLRQRVGENGHPAYEEHGPTAACDAHCYYYSRGSGCATDYDTRGWVNELGYLLVVFDRFDDEAYGPVADFLFTLSSAGGYPDKWSFHPDPDDPGYPFSNAKRSVIRTSMVFWSLASVYASRATRDG